jgi:hypothetical protein
MVQIVTQAEVHRFEREAHGGGDPWWKVHVFSTDAQHQFMAPRECLHDDQPFRHAPHISAPAAVPVRRHDGHDAADAAFADSLGRRLALAVLPGAGHSCVRQRRQPELAGGRARGCLQPGPRRAGVQEWKRSRSGPGKTTIRQGRGTDHHGRDRPARLRASRWTSGCWCRTARCRVPSPTSIASCWRRPTDCGNSIRLVAALGLRHPGARQEDPLAASEGRAQQAQVLLVDGPRRLAGAHGVAGRRRPRRAMAARIRRTSRPTRGSRSCSTASVTGTCTARFGGHCRAAPKSS